MTAVWDNKEMFVKECGVCTDIKYSIIIPQNVYDTFLTLLKEISTEWLLYLVYEKEEVTGRNDEVKGIVFTVTGYKIPEQEVTSTSAKVINSSEIVQEIEEENPDHGAPGVIHAHQFTSSTFFSSIDSDYVNSNNAFSLVINRDGNFKAVARQMLECGRWLIKEAEVCVKFVEDSTIVAELKEHIKTTTYTRPSYYGRGGGKYSGSQSSQDTKGEGKSGSKVFKAETIPLTSRRIKDCPCKDDPSKCTEDNYFTCEFYWIECPKKKGVPKGTLPKELTEANTEAEESPSMKELLLPEDNSKDEETKEITVVQVE